jgi:hypothetical protein
MGTLLPRLRIDPNNAVSVEADARSKRYNIEPQTPLAPMR